MTKTFPALRAPVRDRPRPVLGAGRIALLVGAGLLVLTAFTARHLLTPVAVPVGPPPSIWLSALDAPRLAPFAQSDFAELPVPVPVRRVVVAAAASAPTPPEVTPPLALADARPRPRPDSLLPAPVAAPVAAPDSAVAVAPQAVDPQAALPVLTAELAAPSLRAPTRSPMPRPRPALAPAAPEAAPVVALASLTRDTNLLRSLLPRARPETVARLASLDLPTSVPAAPRAAPAPDPTPLGPLTEAITGADRCDPALTRAIPRRSGGAAGGDSVISRLASASGSQRDGAIIAEVMGGNLPEFLRDLVPVTFEGRGPNGTRTRVTICVMPDYLAVGSDRDFVRVPLGLPAAMRVAERFDMVLPTTRMVDAIYAQARVHLSPAPMEPGSQMSSTPYFQRHNATVQRQLGATGARQGVLVSGHKKDLVLTNRLEANPGRVAIYGWHRSNGAPIQPLSTVHGAQYADYSHGIRLVSRRAYVNGRAVDLRDLLADGRYAGLVSSEGTITNRQMLAALN